MRKAWKSVVFNKINNFEGIRSSSFFNFFKVFFFLSISKAVTNLVIRFSALDILKLPACRAVESKEISFNMSIIIAKSFKKFLLQRRAAIAAYFFSVEKKAGKARHTAVVYRKLQPAHLGPITQPIFKISCPNFFDIL